MSKSLATAFCFFLSTSLVAFAQAPADQSARVDAAISAAVELHRAGKVTECVAVLDKAIQSGLKDPRLHGTKGLALQQQGSIAEADKCYTAALNIDPNYHRARRLRAELASATGNNERGVADTTYLIEHGEPQHHQARGMFQLKLGKALPALGDFSNVMEQLQKQAKPNPFQVIEVCTQRAKAANSLNLWDYATADLDRAKTVFDQIDSPQLTEKDRDRIASPIRQTREAVQSAKTQAANNTETIDLGQVLKQEDSADRVRGISQYLVKNPGDKLAWHFRGKNLYRAGANRFALLELEKAVELGLNDPGTRTELFALHTSFNMHEKALEDANFEIDGGNKDPGSWMQRAMTYDKLSRFDESAADWKYAAEHLQTDSPKDVAPKYIQQRLSLAKYGFTVAQRKIALRNVFKAIEAENPAAILPFMHPALQPYIDVDELKRRFAATNARFGPMTGIHWDNFRMNRETGFLVVSCIVLFEKGQAKCLFYGGEQDALTGFQLVDDQFQLDTRTAIRGFEQPQKTTTEFFRLLFSRKLDSAFKVFDPAHYSAENSAQFAKSMQGLMGAVGELQFDEVRPLITTVEQPSKDVPIQISVYCNTAFKGGACISSKMRFVPNAQGDGFTTNNFHSGNFEASLVNNDFTLAETFCKAIGDGDGDKMLELLQFVNKDELHPGVLRTYTTSMGKHLGKFEKIDHGRFRSTVSIKPQRCDTEYEGLAQFANGQCVVSCKSLYGVLRAISVETKPVWAKNIEDTSVFKKNAEQFLNELILGDLKSAYRLLPPAFQAEIEVAQLEKLRSMCLTEAKGTVNAIEFVKRSYIEEEDGWRFEFMIKGDGAEFGSHVDFAFNPFHGTIDGFHFDVNN